MAATGATSTRERDLRLPDGRNLHIYETGDPRGELVIVHHGTPGSGKPASWWAEDAGVRGILLVGYDRPGYGGSDPQPGRCIANAAADAAAIADSCGALRFRTWGGSGGGPHALACAAVLPERVIACAALCSVAPRTAPGLDWIAGMGHDNVDEFTAATAGMNVLQPFLAEAREQLGLTDSAGLVDALRSLLSDVDIAALRPHVAEFLHEGFAVGLRTSVDGWLGDDLAFVQDWGFDPSLIVVPVLVVHGQRDLMVPFAHGVWLAKIIPGATARLTDSDGHLTLIEDVGEVHAWLLDQR